MAPLVVDPSGYLKPHHSVGHCHLLTLRGQQIMGALVAHYGPRL